MIYNSLKLYTLSGKYELYDIYTILSSDYFTLNVKYQIYYKATVRLNVMENIADIISMEQRFQVQEYEFCEELLGEQKQTEYKTGM